MRGPVTPPSAGRWPTGATTPVRGPVGGARVRACSTPPAPLRMFRNGYQSWTPDAAWPRSASTGIRRPRRARSRWSGPSTMPTRRWPRPVSCARSGSRCCGPAASAPVLVGFDGGDRHDGTLRLRPGRRRPRAVGRGLPRRRRAGRRRGAGAAPGAHRRRRADGADALGAARALGRRGRAGSAGARVSAPYQVGWCSWYHYFHDVTEADLRANLARAGDWPFDVFQLDDGFQSAIGDWLTTNDKFPSGVDVASPRPSPRPGRRPGSVAGAVHRGPRLAGRHRASRLAGPRRRTATRCIGMYNPPWGGGFDGFMWALDTTHPEVARPPRVDRPPPWSTPASPTSSSTSPSPRASTGCGPIRRQTPAQRVRAGYDAVRRGAGDDTFLLGCGVPLANVVGVVDGNRIGPDVAPDVGRPNRRRARCPATSGSLPATVHGWQNTLTRSFMHRTLWLNDPDCLMLRADRDRARPRRGRARGPTPSAVSGRHGPRVRRPGPARRRRPGPARRGRRARPGQRRRGHGRARRPGATTSCDHARPRAAQWRRSPPGGRPRARARSTLDRG